MWHHCDGSAHICEHIEVWITSPSLSWQTTFFVKEKLWILIKILFQFMSIGLFINQSAPVRSANGLVPQATSYNMNQWWPSSPTHTRVTKPWTNTIYQWIKSSDQHQFEIWELNAMCLCLSADYKIILQIIFHEVIIKPILGVCVNLAREQLPFKQLQLDL